MGGNLAEFLATISSISDGMPVSIEQAEHVTKLSRAAVLKRFRELQEKGEGYLKLGRHGHPTRFYFRSQSVAKPGHPNSTSRFRATMNKGGGLGGTAASAGDAGTMSDQMLLKASPDTGESTSDLVNHRYQLRRGFCISIDLPADFTEREASRLARFIETLPL